MNPPQIIVEVETGKPVIRQIEAEVISHHQDNCDSAKKIKGMKSARCHEADILDFAKKVDLDSGLPIGRTQLIIGTL